MSEVEFWEQIEAAIIPKLSIRDEGIYRRLNAFDGRAGRICLATILVKHHPWDTDAEFKQFIAYVDSLFMSLKEKAQGTCWRRRIATLSDRWNQAMKAPRGVLVH